ncbi:MAG TPA: hypothetical protein VGX70_16995 [Gemmataceae bacterium]|jgi:hypothetical protein|nr:hypothetical protein [Gemmataceae bacterium]
MLRFSVRSVVGRISYQIGWFTLCASALVVTSCGTKEPPVYEVRGQVLFNGKPIPYAFVVLHPLEDSRPGVTRPTATTDQHGQFVLSSFHAEDGAPAGEYVATVECRKPKQLDADASIQGPNLLPPRYSKPATSDLRVTVRPASNQEQILRLRQ